jgi:hypothetical protein
VWVHYVATDTRTRIATSIDWAGVSAGAASGMQRHGPPEIRLTDDRGQRHVAAFSGHRLGYCFEGHYVVDPPLSVETKSIRIFGKTVELTRPREDVTVRVEQMTPTWSPARRAARHLIAVASDSSYKRTRSVLAAVVDTFVACGVLAADSAEVREAWAVHDALEHGAAPGLLRPRWVSVLARRRAGHEGPTGSRLVGGDAALPDCRYGRVSVIHLRSSADEFAVVISAVRSGDGTSLDFDNGAGVLAVYADDDVANSYLGEFARSHRGVDGFEATIRFAAPLDPAARALRLTIEFVDASAVITIPLRWDGS